MLAGAVSAKPVAMIAHPIRCCAGRSLAFESPQVDIEQFMALSSHERACERDRCVHALVREIMRASKRAGVRACVRACVRAPICVWPMHLYLYLQHA